LGLAAYAHKQASIFHNLAITFCRRWRSKLISLSHPHDWATEFLKAQGAPLVNPNVKKQKPKSQEHSSSGFPIAPPHVDSPAKNTTAAPPISTNPETGENDDDSSSDDSDIGSEEFDESEYTGDKGPNTHWVHGENIEIAVNM